MSTPPSSTYANNGSVKSSTHPADTNTSQRNTSTVTSASIVEPNSNFTTERIVAYTTNSNDPHPTYTHISAEASMATHIDAATTAIDNFDAVMGEHGTAE